MNQAHEQLQAELKTLEDRIEALRTRILEEDGMAKVRSQQELTDLLLAQKDIQAKLEATGESG